MIKINLLGERSSHDSSKQIFLGLYIASLVLVAGAGVGVSIWLSAQVSDLEQQQQSKQAELKRVQQITQEVKDIEKKQQGLEERLVHIAKLKRNKQGPVRVLDALNTALPERAWLQEIRERNGEFKLNGYALDGETISTFMRELDKSDYFPKVELDVAKQATMQGVKIQEFVIKARVSYGGKLKSIPETGEKNSESTAKKPNTNK